VFLFKKETPKIKSTHNAKRCFFSQEKHQKSKAPQITEFLFKKETPKIKSPQITEFLFKKETPKIKSPRFTRRLLIGMGWEVILGVCLCPCSGDNVLPACGIAMDRK
jgi:hypothetical protein